jgi:raffinose/stachyose/melibiose transport system substrate-binding protein
MRSRARFAVLLTTASILFAACSSGATPTPSASSAAPPSSAASAPASQANAEPVTIDWWHIQNNDPGKSLWQTMADEFHTAHPNVTIKITVLENDTFKPKLQTEIQSGNVPDLFQSWVVAAWPSRSTPVS